VALAVNGSRPKKTLLVRHPYERYVTYNTVPALPWTQVLYVRESLNLPLDVNVVTIDSIVIGVEYKGAFFVSSYPLLEDRPRIETLNTKCLLTPYGNDPKSDTQIVVLETFRYDYETLLHRVRIKSVDYELWCLSKSDDVNVYPKRVRPPELVENYLQFYTRNKSKNKLIGNVNMVQLAMVLARHKICFTTRIVDKNKIGNMILSDDEIVLQMDDKAAEFLNNMRLDALENGNNLDSSGNESCVIL
jgi:hypothetical protein